MLTIGSKAPDFTLQNEAGDLVSLSDFKDQTIVLYFIQKMILQDAQLRHVPIETSAASL
jgi:peroxiredoxin